MGHETTIAAQPSESALDHPSPAHGLEATLLVDTPDDLEIHRLVGESSDELVTGVATVSKDVRNECKRPPRAVDEIGSTIVALHAGGDPLDGKQEPNRVDEQVALDALGLLRGVIADRIRSALPFSVALTLWVSMMVALGEASRFSASPHVTRSA